MCLTAIHSRDEFAEPLVAFWRVIWHVVHFCVNIQHLPMPSLIANASCILSRTFLDLFIIALVLGSQVMPRPKIAYLETVLHLQSQTLDVPAQLHVLQKSTW